LFLYSHGIGCPPGSRTESWRPGGP